MVGLDDTLKDTEPWPEVAAILRKRMQVTPLFRQLTIVLRAVSPDDEISVVAQDQDAGHGMTADHGGSHFEFAFRRDENPPGELKDLMTWVDVTILDRVDQCLESHEEEDDVEDLDD